MIAAYKYCAEDQTLVDAYGALNSDLQTWEYWSEECLSDLRARVKDFYIQAQKFRCCYCNRHLATGNHRNWDIEHIVSRKSHPHFMFETKNLAASCPDCNIRKAEKDSLANKRRKKYPKKSKDFIILHIHFDKFDDHIFVDDLVYLGKTKKGTNTIYTCDLLRFAQDFIEWKNNASDTSFEQDVEAVFEKKPDRSEAAVKAIVKKLKVR